MRRGSTATSPWGHIKQYIPLLQWGKAYNANLLSSDIFAGIITAILLIPQGIAYAFLAGLPAEVGIYSSLLPPLLYVIFGTSRVLSVGPVSIAAIMVANALTSPEVLALGSPTQNAMILALEGGILLCLMSFLKMGSLVQYISQPVLSGFTTGAAIIIVLSQLPKMLGLDITDCGSLIDCMSPTAFNINHYTLCIGVFAFFLLYLMGGPFNKLLSKLAIKKSYATALSKSAPLISIIIGIVLVQHFSLNTTSNVSIVGAIPLGLPIPSIEFLDVSSSHLLALLPSATLISFIAFVESVAIAKLLATLRNEKLDSNQELIGLGAANMGAAFTGGMPVAGGFSRTMVNFSAGAQSQVAMFIAVIVLSIGLVLFAHTLESIPKAVLAAIIVIAVAPLIKLKSLVSTWRFDRAEGLAQLVTLLGVLIIGIEEGIVLGVLATIISYLRRAGKPHIAVVGQIQNTDHFRNVKRHAVQTWDELLMIRVDDSITFANIDYISKFIDDEYQAQRPQHIVLIFSSVSYLDTSAVSYFKQLIMNLKNQGCTLSLSEVKGPVLDIIAKSDLEKELFPGKIFLQTADAVKELTS